MIGAPRSFVGRGLMPSALHCRNGCTVRLVPAMPRLLKFAIHLAIVIGAICLLVWLISGRASAHATDTHPTPAPVWQSCCNGGVFGIAPPMVALFRPR